MKHASLSPIMMTNDHQWRTCVCVRQRLNGRVYTPGIPDCTALSVCAVRSYETPVRVIDVTGNLSAETCVFIGLNYAANYLSQINLQSYIIT